MGSSFFEEEPLPLARIMQKNKDILDKVFECHPRDFNVKLWNGRLVEWSQHPKFTLVFKDKSSFRWVFLKGDAFTVGRAYVEGGLDIEGDLFEAIKLGDYLSQLKLSYGDKLRILGRLLSL